MRCEDQEKGSRGTGAWVVYPFLINLFLFGALLFLFPQIALFLPSYLMR
ncbi:MAG: hypothetical protein H6Q55_2160 [Deltaproteobacteria bacterium]|nr:hypothetical protein [Deltaproteobacteria bacterium]